MKIQQTKKINVARLVIAILCLSFFLTCNASAANIPELPPAFSVKWDISKKDNLLAQDFVVHKEHYTYSVCISFMSINKKYFSREEAKQLRDFLNYNHKGGVIIPVSLKIEKVDGDQLVPFLPKEIINTYGRDSYSTAVMDRIIKNVVLPTGRYRITVRVSHEIKLTPNVETFLSIFTHG